MKSLVAVSVCFLGACAPAIACNADLLEVVDWRVVENAGNKLFPYFLEADLSYRGERGFRMIHAGVILNDVLGQPLGQVNLERDSNVSPGDQVTASGQVTVKERLAKVNRDDVVVRSCVWSIVYDDGDVEEFN